MPRASTSCCAHRFLTLLVFLATIALTAGLYVKTPKGFFPQDDTGLIFGGDPRRAGYLVRGHEGAAAARHEIVLSDPAVAYVGSSVGGVGVATPRSTTAGCSSA